MSLTAEIRSAFDGVRGGGRLMVVTGAGLSAPSGIPTFRGPEGYWTVGSRVYQPQELATAAAFAEMPFEVWQWYLYRRGVCRNAQPNAAHMALVKLQRRLGNAMQVVTQNVDGLHLRAGHVAERLCEIHGSLDFTRCDVCGSAPEMLPEELCIANRDDALSAEQRQLLLCKQGHLRRPHILWFDEYYDPRLFPLSRMLESVRGAAMVMLVGTSGSTALPVEFVRTALALGVPLMDVNPEATGLFTESATAWHVRADAAEFLPALAQELR